MRWVHAVLGSLLALGGSGLTVGLVWAVGIPTYLCAEGIPRPSGWIYAGLVLFAVGILIAVALGALMIEATPILQRIYIGIALVEAATAVVLAVYLSGKYSHYECG